MAGSSSCENVTIVHVRTQLIVVFPGETCMCQDEQLKNSSRLDKCERIGCTAYHAREKSTPVYICTCDSIPSLM